MWQDIAADPSSPDAEERLERYYSGQALEFLLGLLDTYRTDKLTLLPNPDVPPVIVTVDEPELIPSSDPPTAMITVCQIDSGILMLADDNGLQVPINTDVVRVVARVTVELVGGIWRMSDGGTGDEEIGETSCDGL